MSRLDDTLQDAIYDWIFSITGVSVIWDKQDSQGSQKGEKPPLPYITLNISSGPNRVSSSSERYKVLDTWKYRQVFAFTLSINSYAKNQHLTLLQNIISGIDLPTKQDILRTGGLAVWVVNDPVDISALENTGHELRGNLDIEMSYGVETDDIPGEVQTVNIDGTLNTDAGNVHNININKTIIP